MINPIITRFSAFAGVVLMSMGGLQPMPVLLMSAMLWTGQRPGQNW